MSEFIPDFRSPEALIKSYREHAIKLRARAARIADQGDREMFELLASAADQDAEDIRDEMAAGYYKEWRLDDSKQE